MVGGLLAGILVAGCGDEAAADLDDPESRRDAITDQFEGVLTTTEASCVADSVFADEAQDPQEVFDFIERPEPDSPIFALVSTAFADCVDPATPLPPTPAEGGLRDGVEAGILATLPQLTDDEVNCIIDALLELGVGVRELTIAGYLPDQAAVLQNAFSSAGTTCLPEDG